MKIKTIGTGALTGYYKSFSTLIDDKILVDCGNGIVKTLLEQNVDISNIEYLLITHMHGDHYFDIPFFIIQRDILKSKKQLKIFCPKDGIKMIKELTKLAFIDLYGEDKEYNDLLNRTNTSIIEIEKDNYQLDNNHSFKKLDVTHGELENTLAYIISNNRIKVGISGDSAYCKSIDKLMDEVDIGILDMSFEKGSIWHMGLEDIEKLINKYHKKIIANHLSSAIREKLINYKNELLIIPKDGDEFNIGGIYNEK